MKHENNNAMFSFRLLVLLAICFGLDGVYAATTIDAVNRGWYRDDGVSNGAIAGNNYFVGDQPTWDALENQYRNWFSFDLSNLASSLPGPVTSATLILGNPTSPYGSGYTSPDSTESYVLYDLKNLANEQLGADSRTIYRDLGTGVTFGSYETTASDSLGNPISIQLNSDGVLAVKRAVGTQFELGGTISTLDSVGSDEFIFGWTGWGAPTQLSLTFGTPPSTSTILSNSVDVTIRDDIIYAEFSPQGGVTLQEAAALLGVDHFNWINIVTKDNALVFPFLTNGQNADMNGNYPSVPYFDPVAGGYQYQADARENGFPVRDAFPWYLDEVFTFDGEEATHENRLLSEIDAMYSIGEGVVLGFEDAPSSFANIEFLTALVGVKADGTGVLFDFPTTVFRWAFDGGLDQFLYWSELTAKTFDEFTSEELALLQGIPFRRESVPAESYGSLRLLPYVEFSDSERGFLQSLGLQVQGSVPEPTTLALFGLGLAGLGAVRRKKLAA